MLKEREEELKHVKNRITLLKTKAKKWQRTSGNAPSKGKQGSKQTNHPVSELVSEGMKE